jgi:hypothetical protein
MKPVFKCDYCDFMDTEEEVHKHEEECYKNYNKRNCMTCMYKKMYPSKETLGFDIECKSGIELPNGKMMERCKKYKREEKEYGWDDILCDVFGVI